MGFSVFVAIKPYLHYVNFSFFINTDSADIQSFTAFFGVFENIF